MALIKCPECGREISDKATSCPNCGYPTGDANHIVEDVIKYGVVTCRKCGYSIPAFHSHCDNCGAELDRDNEMGRNDSISPNQTVSYPNYNNRVNKGNKFLPIIFIIFVIILTIKIGPNLFKADKSNDTITFNLDGTQTDNIISVKEEDISIENFKYDIVGNLIKLQEYNGESKTLEIKSEYTIDDTSYKTDLSDFQVSNRKVRTIIFDEGISEVKVSIFNGSGAINQIFFPESINKIYDYTLAYLHPEEGTKIKVYYAGTEFEWGNIFTEYTHIDGTEGLAETAGQAAADFINGFIGMEYDSSQFVYYFSASLDQIE